MFDSAVLVLFKIWLGLLLIIDFHYKTNRETAVVYLRQEVVVSTQSCHHDPLSGEHCSPVGQFTVT